MLKISKLSKFNLRLELKSLFRNSTDNFMHCTVIDHVFRSGLRGSVGVTSNCSLNNLTVIANILVPSYSTDCCKTSKFFGLHC